MRPDNEGSSAYKVLAAGTAANGTSSHGRGRRGAVAQCLDDYFHISDRGSTIATEVRAGAIAWMTMSYIMVVNPVILCRAATKHDPLLAEAVMTATALSAAVGSLVVGVLGDAPLGLMPGMGLNAYFVFGLCHAFGVSWQEALSCCFVSGAILVLFSVLGVCEFVVSKVLSEHLKKAITVAIGVFQALIGFQVMGLVVGSPDTLVTLGDLELSNANLYLSIAGFLLISAMLVVGKVHGAFLIGIWAMAACSWVVGLEKPPQGLVELPRLDASFSISFAAWSPGHGKLPGMIVGTLVLLFVALFDLAGVQYGLMGIANLLVDGQVPRSTAIFTSAGIATMVGACLGTSPVIIANESSAGIVEGAKTGLMAVVVAVLFLLSAFIGPLLSAVPHVATAVPLVLIGAFMMAPCRGIDWNDLRVAIPAFLTMTVVPFTYSIHTGIIAGILMDLFLAMCAKPFEASAPDSIAVRRSNSESKVATALLTPHMTMSSHREDKAELAMQLLGKLAAGGLGHSHGMVVSPSLISTPCDEAQRCREEVLREALEAYLDGH